MFKCPQCKAKFPFWRTIFYSRRTKFVCKNCGTVSKVKRNYWLSFLSIMPSGFIGVWIANSHFSVVSITVFFAYLTMVLIITLYFEKLEIHCDTDH